MAEAGLAAVACCTEDRQVAGGLHQPAGGRGPAPIWSKALRAEPEAWRNFRVWRGPTETCTRAGCGSEAGGNPPATDSSGCAAGRAGT